MKKSLILLFLAVLLNNSMYITAQQITKVYINGYAYVCVDNSAMPADVVKTYEEMQATIDPVSHVTKRHSIASGNEANPNINLKPSRKFIISPTNIACSNWCEASGWLASSVSNTALQSVGVAANPATGCAAYAGRSGKEKGQWRIPTAREMEEITLFIDLIDNLLPTVGGTSMNTTTAKRLFYVSTEAGNNSCYLAQIGSNHKLISNCYSGGQSITENPGAYLRCVRDIE